MDKKPMISCIMAVYNTEKYLDEAIQSILNQTYTDFEFIISDDGSTDKSKEIIKKYAKKDRRIKFLDNKKNRGILPNLNDCINNAKGDYIAIMESDDVSYPERFELELKSFNEDKDLFLVGGYGNIIDEQGKRKYDRITIENYEEIKKKCLFDTPFNTPGIMFKSTLGAYFKSVKNSYVRDNDLYLNTIFSGKKCTNIPQYIIKKRELDNSLYYRKFLKIRKYHLLLRLSIVHKYKVYKEQKFIYYKVIINEIKGVLGYYFFYYTKKLGIYKYISGLYHLCFGNG